MHNIDWGGLATMLGAVGAFIGTLATVAMQIISWQDARRARLEQAAHKEKLDAIAADVSTIKKVDTQ